VDALFIFFKREMLTCVLKTQINDLNSIKIMYWNTCIKFNL